MLGGRNWASLEIHLEAVFMQIWRYAQRTYSSKFDDTLGGCERVTLDMHLKVMIERDWI
jgi:hypothetical protein